jgi:Phage head-tail joining protein.
MALGKQIVLERWTVAKDNKGNKVESCDLRITKFAEPVRSGGSRSSLNGKTSLENVMTFKMTFRSDLFLTGNWKVVYLGRRHTIHSIERSDEDRFIWIITANSKGVR